MVSIRTLVSTGPGRLHLMQTANALQASGEDVRVISGWIPNATAVAMGTVAARCGVANTIVHRLQARAACDGFPRDRVTSCGIVDALGMIAQRLVVGEGSVASRTRRWAWEWFGRASRRHIRRADLLHVRSGAGGGGAIQAARKQRMAVVSDHSIAHPSWMADVLTDEYARYGSPCPYRRADPFWQGVEQDCLAADAVVVNSDFVAKTFMERGFPPERLHVAYLGVSPDWFGLKRSYAAGQRIRLLFVGEFGIRKGAGYLLDALTRLDPERRRFNLVVVGRHPELPLLARRHRIAPSDRFIGGLDAGGVRAHVAKADIFVFPSLAEGCAKAAMEALAAGLPLVATRETGLPPAADDHVLLVASRSVESLCEALTRLAADENLRHRLGEGGSRLAAERFTWRRYGDQVRDFHLQVLTQLAG